jgi:hypothetical protein
MIFNAKSNMVFVHEISGVTVDLTMSNMMPVQKALEIDGGTIWLKSVWLDFKSTNFYVLYYGTPCGRITMKVELTEEEFNHNVGFFGDPNANYESGISFGLDGNKFVMP